MYLSEFIIEWPLHKNPYDIHRYLWDAFPGMPDEDRPFLFRASPVERGEPIRVLMQSAIAPSDKLLSSGCSLCRSKEFKPVFHKGQILRFLLFANPVKRLSKERCRVPLIRQEEQIEWIQRKLKDGADILEAKVIGRQSLYFKKKGMACKLDTVTFSGLINVTIPDKFLNIISSGIGAAKSFGCGLMSVARA